MLKYTLDQVRDREIGYVGTKGLPNPWWPLKDPETADCLGFQLYCMGVRSRRDLTTAHISIHAFLASAGWDTVAADQVRPGDLLMENWSGGGENWSKGPYEPEHTELCYSVIGDKVTSVSANTGPAPGIDSPRGVWKKTRTRGKWLLFGVRPPYKGAAATVTASRRDQVRTIAKYVNGWRDLDTLPRTASQEDGIPGPIYWTLIQTWGRAHGIYGPTYVIDGVPGPRTHYVEGVIWGKAKAAHKA